MPPGHLDVSSRKTAAKMLFYSSGCFPPSDVAASGLPRVHSSNEDAEPGTAPQECTYRKVWEDDGNIQRVEIEQTAMVFFKTIYTRMHVLQARPMRLSTCMPVQNSDCFTSCLPSWPTICNPLFP